MKLGYSFLMLAMLSGVATSEARELGGASVSCRVLGYDVTIVNESDSVLEEGVSVNWFVPFDQTGGEHALRSPLDPGGTRLLAGSLSSYLSTDIPCEAHQDEDSNTQESPDLIGNILN